MRTGRFNVSWEAEDGYCGGGRPQHCYIHADEIEPEMSENDLRTLFCDTVQADFENRVSWTSGDEDKFVEWAKQIQSAQPKEGQ